MSPDRVRPAPILAALVLPVIAPRSDAQEPPYVPPLALQPAPVPAAMQRGRDRLPNFDLQLRFGGGTFDHDTDGSGFDGDTDAGYFAFQFEGHSDRGFGGGLRLEGYVSDDDLFDDAGSPNTEASSGELFLFFSYRAAAEGFRIPLRTGLAFSSYAIEDNVLGDEVQYDTLAFRFELEPELDLVRNETAGWSLYANAGFGFGATTIDTEPATFEADSDAFLFNFDLGTRVQVGPVLLGLGYLLRRSTIDDSDVVGGLFFRGIDTTFSGLQLTVGGRF